MAALLAFEVGPAVAGPLVDLTSGSVYSSCSNTANASSCTLTFYALPGQASSQTETLTATYISANTLTFTVNFGSAKASPPFTGATMSKSIHPPSSVTSKVYGYTGEASAGVTGASASAAGSILVKVTNNTSATSQSSTVTLHGTTVAPIESTSNTNAGFTLVGRSTATTITVQNNGEGNLATGTAGVGKGTASSLSNLNGTIGSSAGMFTGAGGALGGGSGLPDITSSPAAATSQTFTYVFTPTVRTPGGTSALVNATFSNGMADGSNASTIVPITITGTGVAPVDSGMTGGDAKFVLVKTGSANVSVTVSNANGDGNLSGLGSVSNLNGTLQQPSGSTQFSGGSFNVSLTDGTTQAVNYTFAPTVRGSASATVTGNFVNGSADNTNQSHTNTATIVGTGVAPVNSVSSVSPVFARVGGTTATAQVSVTNIGDGNLATGGPSPSSNLNGSVGGAAGPAQWSGAGGNLGGGSGLADASNGQPLANTSQAFNYTYNTTGTARGTSLSASVTVGLTNGSSDNTNNAQNVNVTLVGNTVGPVYQSQHNAAINTPVKNGGSASLIDWGTISTVGKHTELLQISNITTDLNGGNDTLTDLDIEKFTITGAANFTIHGKQSGVGTQGLGTADIISKGGDEFIAIDFSTGASAGTFDGQLTLFTDEDTSFLGAGGNFYVYNLTALSLVPAPEPESLLLLSVGIGGVLLIRRRRPRGNG